MARQLSVQQTQQDQSGWSHLTGGTLQRKCSSCGNHTLAVGECSECRKKKWKGVQTKLKIGVPSDAYEREADRIADQVMAMPTPVTANKTPIKVQRFSEHASGEAAEAPPSVERVLNSPGRPLPTDLAEDMGNRFGHDFSDVRIHTSVPAAYSARDVQARAYTLGMHLVFNEGEYQPQTTSGRRLLAHELVHTLQQAEKAGIERSTTNPNILLRDEDGGGSSSRALLDRVLPVGNGFYFEINGGITWGFPIYTGGSSIIYVDRITEEYMRIIVRKEGTLAFDTGVGGSLMIGRRGARTSTSRRRGIGIGAEAGANFMAGFRGVFIEQYNIPTTELLDFVSKSILNTALTTRLPAGLGDILLTLLARNGYQYLTHHHIEGGVFAQADAEAGAGIRRPSDNFTETGSDDQGFRVGSGVWGPGTEEREFQGSRPHVTNMDPLALLNFLNLFASAHINTQLTMGIDQTMRSNTTVTSLFLEGQIGAMIDLPIPVIGELLSILPQGAGGGVELRFVHTSNAPLKITAVIYLKQGEDQYYNGPASQQNMEFSLTNLISIDQLIRAMQTGRMPPVSGIPVGDLLKSVSLFQRISLGGQSRGFASLLRRQQGVRSLLSTNTLSKARRIYGVNIETYVDLGAQMSGIDFRDLAGQLLAVGRGAYNAANDGENLTSAYQMLSSYLSGYASSSEFERLQSIIFNVVSITIAKLRIQVGGGIGISARVAEGAKARIDVSGEAGLSCELDFVALRGGELNLGHVVDSIQDVLNNPVTYLPNCPIIRSLYSDGTSGSNLSQSSSAAIGNEEQTTSMGRAPQNHTEGSNDPYIASQSIERRQASPPRRLLSSSTDNITGQGLEISHHYPDRATEIEFPILGVFGDLKQDTPINTIVSLTFTIQVEHADNRRIHVPIRVKVIENSGSRVELEVVDPWWIEDLQIGSNIGHIYTLEWYQ